MIFEGIIVTVSTIISIIIVETLFDLYGELLKDYIPDFLIEHWYVFFSIGVIILEKCFFDTIIRYYYLWRLRREKRKNNDNKT